MHNLQLDGVEVCRSWLTQSSFRAAYCDLLLPVTPDSKDAMLAEFRREGECGGKYSGLRISGISDLSFLKEFPLLRYLEVIYQQGVNTRHLDCLANLRGLRMESPGAGIDFACFPELEVFVGDWHVDNRNLHRGRELRRLRFSHFKPRSKDLSDLSNITRLEMLAVVQTNIASLAGLETLDDLRYLEIDYASKLESLDALAHNNLSVRELHVEVANRISSYQPIASVRLLRRLRLSSCAPMPDLRWTMGMNHLDFFSFVKTNVSDGDLSPLLNLPKLQYVGTLDKRHYNYTSDELNGVLKQRDRARSLNHSRESGGED